MRDKMFLKKQIEFKELRAGKPIHTAGVHFPLTRHSRKIVR